MKEKVKESQGFSVCLDSSYLWPLKCLLPRRMADLRERGKVCQMTTGMKEADSKKEKQNLQVG